MNKTNKKRLSKVATAMVVGSALLTPMSTVLAQELEHEGLKYIEVTADSEYELDQKIKDLEALGLRCELVTELDEEAEVVHVEDVLNGTYGLEDEDGEELDLDTDLDDDELIDEEDDAIILGCEPIDAGEEITGDVYEPEVTVEDVEVQDEEVVEQKTFDIEDDSAADVVEDTDGEQVEGDTDADVEADGEESTDEGVADDEESVSDDEDVDDILLGNVVQATVLRVIDGDTIEVDIEGTTETVRFIGMDTPERGEDFFDEASDFARSLVEGQEIYLQEDGNARDNFGRMRSHVWLAEPSTDEANIRENLVGARLISEGLARVRTGFDNSHEELFLQLQAEAQAAGLGMWGTEDTGGNDWGTDTLPQTSEGVAMSAIGGLMATLGAALGLGRKGKKE